MNALSSTDPVDFTRFLTDNGPLAIAESL